jgi:DUF4097 and DUF4098 domain-containing protein YvlB
MNEIERIQSMVASGTITEDEADRLIALLRDIDRTEQNVGAVAAEAEATGAAESAPPDMSRARADTTAADPSGVAGAAPDTGSHGARLRTPEGFRWFKIATLAGDIDVTVDGSLAAPEVDGPEGISVRETADGYELRLERAGSFLDRLLSGRVNMTISIRLPENMGVDLRLKAGDVELRDVPYVKGHILAGDVDARGLRGIDLNMSAGDLDLSLLLTEGEHRVNMTAGDMHVRLDPASQVTVDGRVNIGDARVPEGFDVSRSGVGESFAGTIGNGAARLQISQSTGDTRVSVDHA